MPKISIILTSFNHEKYICEAIDSILAQTFTDFELIIWDDASSDNSWGIIKTYSDSRIKAFRNDECRRAIYGVTKAIKEIAAGEYIAFHHSDDVWEKDKLEKQIEFLDTHPETGAVFTHALAIDENGEPLNDPGHFYSNIFDQPNRTRLEWLNYFFYHGNALCHPSVLIRKHCYTDCGTYRYGFAQVGDFDMWIRLCLKYEIHVLQQKFIRFRVRADEANTSGSRPDARIRGATESYQLFDNYLKLDSFEEFAAVFPEAERFYKKEGFVPGFVLAMLSLGPNTLHMAKVFGVISLFNLLWDDKTSQKIKELYGFDYRNLIEITGKYDIFSLEVAPILGRTAIEQDEQIASLNKTIIEARRALSETQGELGEIRNALSRVFASRSWKITRPLRVLNGAVRWRQLPPNKISNDFKLLAVSLQQRGIMETAYRIAARLRVMTAMSARVDASWATASVARSATKLPYPHDQIRRKTTLISMVRNEKSIMEAFCAHALSLFDRIILVDHLSSDGTREYIKLLSEKYPSIEYLYFEEPGYYQSELMTWIARNVVDNEISGWVFFLDADEFMPFKSKEEFDSKLSEFRSFPVISMPWLNLIPLDMESGRVIDELFLKPPKPSFNCKIAFQPSLIPLDDYIVAQGNHALLMGDEFSQRLPVENAFPIYHLPIRTKQQLREKLLHGVESYRRMGKNRTTNLGFHWDEINQIMESSSLTNEMMAGIASRYGDPLSPPYERDLNELKEKGYSEMRMDVCFTQLMASFCDIKLVIDEEIKEKTVSSTYTSSGSEGPQKISLDPVTHSLRFSK